MPNIVPYKIQLSSTDNYGSITYLKIPNANEFTGIVPFKYNIPPYGNWPNTTECNIGGDQNKHQCPITQTTYSDGTTQLPQNLGTLKWKCSEVAYHAQKLLDYRQQLENNHTKDQATINYLDQWIRYMQQLPILPDKIFLPRDHWDPILKQIAQNLGEYNYTNNNYYSFNNKLKAGPNAKENYTRMKFVVGLKVEQHPALMEQAKFFAENNLIPIECSQYDDTWASGKSGKGKNLLGQIIFELGSEEFNKSNTNKISINTQQKYNDLKQKHHTHLTHENLLSHKPANMTLVSMPYTSKAPTKTTEKTSNPPAPIEVNPVTAEEAKKLIIAAITQESQQTPTTLKVGNDLNKSGQKVLKVTFNTKEQAEQFKTSVQAQHTENNGLTVILGQDKTNFFFKKHSLNTHLITILAQDKKEHKIFTNSNKSPKERVLNKISNASNIEIDNNNNLIVNFNSQEDAYNFSQKNNNVEVKNQNDNFVVILNQNQLNQFLNQHNIATHGMTAHIPMIKALKYEQSCNNIESCFNFKKSTTDDLQDIQYKKLWNASVTEKTAKNMQDTIGTICSKDPNSKDLAIIKENSIECPTDTTNNLTPTQNEIFITFLEMHNNPNVTIEANNFSPKDLTALLDLLSNKEPKLNVKLELPEKDNCVYGNNEKYTETEYKEIQDRIDLFNNKTTKNQHPKPGKQ